MSSQRQPRGRKRAPPIVRMGHPLAFVSFLNKIGAPVHRRLRGSGLPIFCQDPDALVPLSRTWQLFDQAARLDAPMAGWQAGRHAADENLNHALLNSLRRAPTLYRSFHQLIQMSAAESSHVRLGIREREDDVLFFTRHPGLREEPGYMQSQLYQLQVFISVIRHFAGPNWMPKEIGVEHAPEPNFIVEDLHGCRVRRAQPAGYVAVSRMHLHKGAQRTNSGNGTPDLALAGDQGYADVLAALLKPYLSEGYPTMRLAADLMDTSPRTLARRLSTEGLGYRGLVDQVRFRVARDLLRQPDVRLSNVAWSVGFRHQTHFTRMFRRIGGLTPGQMRRAALRNQA